MYRDICYGFKIQFVGKLFYKNYFYVTKKKQCSPFQKNKSKKLSPVQKCIQQQSKIQYLNVPIANSSGQDRLFMTSIAHLTASSC